MSSGTNPQLIQSVEKAIAVFEFLCRSDASLRIAEISRGLNMNKTTVFRILQTYKGLGYVEQERNTDRYSPTLRVAAMSIVGATPRISEIREELAPLVVKAVGIVSSRIF